MTFLLRLRPLRSSLLFFFNDTATTEIYTLSLHDALPILWNVIRHPARPVSEVIWVYGIGMLALNALIAALSLSLQRRFGLDEDTVRPIYFVFSAARAVTRTWPAAWTNGRLGEARPMCPGAARLRL